MNKIIKNTIIITLITVVAGLLLGAVYHITKEPIAKAQAKAQTKAYQEVLSEATDFEKVDVDIDTINSDLPNMGYEKDLVDDVVVGKKNNEIVGYVFTITSKEGFGGNIDLTVGVLKDGTTSGISFLSISETAGLGMKSTEPKFKDQFKNKKVESFKYTKTGASADNEIDALSGATITTNAVTNAVDCALFTFNEYIGGDK